MQPFPNSDSERVSSFRAAQAFVAWIDIMGAGALMRSSLPSLANSVVELTEMCRGAVQSGITLHPLNDGIFAVTGNRDDALAFLCRTFTRMATRLEAVQSPNIFMVRGSIAHGDVVTVTQPVLTHTTITLLGPAKSAAFQAEDRAAPFGVCVDQSAVVAGVPPEWRWYAPEQRDPVLQALERHYVWLRDNANSYRPERLDAHLMQMRRYFAGSGSGDDVR